MRRRMRKRPIIGGMVVLGVVFCACMLGQLEVEQIENHIGKNKAEYLLEEEFIVAMDELAIAPQEPPDERNCIA